MMKINYRYILIAAVLLVALLSLPSQAKRKKVVVAAAPILSAQDQRRMDSLFLESVCERLKGNDSIARCLLEECRDLNPYAAEPYFFLAKYYADDGNDSLVQAYLEKPVSLRPDNQTFNPHTHAGCDRHCNVVLLTSWDSFNPHTHAGCDLPASAKWREAGGFNPHTHAGCDITCIFF